MKPKSQIVSAVESALFAKGEGNTALGFDREKTAPGLNSADLDEIAALIKKYCGDVPKVKFAYASASPSRNAAEYGEVTTLRIVCNADMDKGEIAKFKPGLLSLAFQTLAEEGKVDQFFDEGQVTPISDSGNCFGVLIVRDGQYHDCSQPQLAIIMDVVLTGLDEGWAIDSITDSLLNLDRQAPPPNAAAENEAPPDDNPVPGQQAEPTGRKNYMDEVRFADYFDKRGFGDGDDLLLVYLAKYSRFLASILIHRALESRNLKDKYRVDMEDVTTSHNPVRLIVVDTEQQRDVTDSRIGLEANCADLPDEVAAALREAEKSFDETRGAEVFCESDVKQEILQSTEVDLLKEDIMAPEVMEILREMKPEFSLRLFRHPSGAVFFSFKAHESK